MKSVDFSFLKMDDILCTFVFLLLMLSGLQGSINDEETVMDSILNANSGLDLSLFEGDIVLDKDDNLQMVHQSEKGDIDGNKNISKRNAIRDREKIWQDRFIPYEIDTKLSSIKKKILIAIDEFHKKTCLKFLPKTTEKHWIKFILDRGCWSYIGRTKSHGYQKISFGAGCHRKGTMIHEIMHAIGFYHEQSRTDRNKYIEIFWENIKDKETVNFKKYNQNILDHLGVQYDYQSIMHYGSKTFSKNGFSTIKVLGKNNAVIGQRNGLSNTDVIKINSLYSCHLKGKGWSEWSGYTPCSRTCKKQRQRYCFSSYPQHCRGVSQSGIVTQVTRCADDQCYAAIEGHWGRWSDWSACSQSCGQGKRSRTRQCDDPQPRNNGGNCQGSTKETGNCVEGACGLGPDDCEFDPGQYCHWRSTSKPHAKYKWTTYSGRTPSSNTGPDGDHTSGRTGYYIYAEATRVRPGSIALLSSKVFQPSKCRCISWYFHMRGSGIGQLKLSLLQLSTNNKGLRTRTLWKRIREQGAQWIMGEATISNVSQTPYKVDFEGIRGSNFKGDIALDDIFFKEHPCGVQLVGCYQDTFIDRALSVLIANLRHKIDLQDMNKTINECACLAYEGGYKYFAVQFYGQCWGSKNLVAYDKHGTVSCFNGVGKELTTFVYQFRV